jgi:hypothetical protein
MLLWSTENMFGRFFNHFNRTTNVFNKTRHNRQLINTLTSNSNNPQLNFKEQVMLIAVTALMSYPVIKVYLNQQETKFNPNEGCSSYKPSAETGSMFDEDWVREPPRLR